MSLVQKRQEYVNLLSTSLAEAIDKLSKSDSVRQISLFGSYVRGKPAYSQISIFSS